MNKYSGYFIVLMLITVMNAGATTYYVSSAGDDDNSGTNTDSPWQNCPGMPAWEGSVNLKAGDIVYFNSGDTWTASSGEAVLMVTAGVLYDGETWGTGDKAIFRATGDLNRSVVGFLSDDPVSPTIVKGFELDANHTITNGIGFNYPFWSNNMTGAVKRVENCIVHDVYSETNRGEYKYGIIISNWGGNNAVVENVEIINCTVYNISRDGILAYPGGDQANNRVGKILIRECEVYSTGQDPGYGAGAGIVTKNRVYDTVVEYNYLHNTSGPGILISGTLNGYSSVENIKYRFNLLHNNNHDAFHLRESGDKSIEIYGNIILAGNASALKVDGSSQGGLDLKIYNNTLFDTDILIQNSSSSVSSLEVINNIIYSPGQQDPVSDSGNNITVESNNIYSDPLFKNTSDLPSGFIGTYGIDIEPNTDGLSIKDDSPAKNTGATLGSDYNYSVNSVMRPDGTGWDIGAYELDEATSLNDYPKSPQSYLLYQNEPNPFNPSTTIKFDLPQAGYVTISIYNSLGQSVETILDDYLPSGSHKIVFEAKNRSSGIYFYRIDAGDFHDVKRMILLR